MPSWKDPTREIDRAPSVPIVPVVLKNALDPLPRDGLAIRPATIEGVVQRPLPTTGWRREDLDVHIAEIEKLYHETLTSGRFLNASASRSGAWRESTCRSQ